MTADQRLDQLEPLVSQTLAVADRHTAQLKQIIGILSQQSESTQFLLEEMVKVKSEISELKNGVSELKADSTASKTAQATMGSKLDRIIDLLSGDK
jgi:phage shock protein A